MARTKCGFDDVPGGASGADQLVLMGPTLAVDVGFDPAYRPGNAPTPGIRDLIALVDTGATECCIDAMLAVELGLPAIDRRAVAGVSGSDEVNMYLAQVRVPSLNSVIYGSFAGVHLRAGGQPHWVLIGRTFLKHYTMIYEGRTGTVILSSDQPCAEFHAASTGSPNSRT